MPETILIVTSEMIPYADNWGSAQRMYYLAKQLAKSEYSTIVLSRKQNSDYNDYGNQIDFEQVFVPSNMNFSNNNEIKKNDLISKAKLWIKPTVYRLEKEIFNEPIRGMGIQCYLWRNKMIAKVESIIKEKNVKILIISGPPFTLFEICPIIKKKYSHIKIIIDYRDPWNLWNDKKGISFIREKKAIGKANCVVTTTEEMRNKMVEVFNIEKCIAISNGYSEELWTKIDNDNTLIVENDRIVISYIGSIHFIKNSFRDTNELLKAYSLFREKAKIEMRFIGVACTKETEEMKKEYPEIKFIPKVQLFESLKYMKSSDVLLNIHTTSDNSSKYLIGAKIYDYLRSGKHIISINNANSYEHKLLKNYDNVFLCENRHEEILKIFEKIIELKKLKKLNQSRSTEDSYRYSREYTNKEYSQYIFSMINS